MLNYILSVEQVEGAVQMLIACVVNIDWRLKPRHIYREGDRVADWLANKSLSNCFNFICVEMRHQLR